MSGDTLFDLGVVLRTGGDPDGAATALRAALGFFEAKGKTSAAEATRRRLSEIAG